MLWVEPTLSNLFQFSVANGHFSVVFNNWQVWMNLQANYYHNFAFLIPKWSCVFSQSGKTEVKFKYNSCSCEHGVNHVFTHMSFTLYVTMDQGLRASSQG